MAMEPWVRPGFRPMTVRPAIVVEPLNVAGPLTVSVDKVEVAAERVPAIAAPPELVRLLAETGPVTVRDCAEARPETLRLPLIVVLPEANVPADRLLKPARLPPV